MAYIDRIPACCHQLHVTLKTPTFGKSATFNKVSWYLFPSNENAELSKVASSKPGEGKNIALVALPTAMNSASLMSAFHVHLTSFLFDKFS